MKYTVEITETEAQAIEDAVFDYQSSTKNKSFYWAVADKVRTLQAVLGKLEQARRSYVFDVIENSTEG